MNVNISKVLVATLVAIMAIGCTQKRDGFIINGTVTGGLELDSITITPESMDDVKPIYTVPVVNGKFTVKGKVKDIEKVNIGNDKANIGNNFILENEEYTIDINEEFFTIKGGKVNEEVFGFYNSKEFEEIMKQYRALTQKLMTVDMESEDGRDEMYQLNRQIDVFMNKAYNIEDEHYKKLMNDENASTLTKMFVVTSSQDYGTLPIEKRRELLAEYKKELGEHNNLINFVKYLDQQDLKEEMSKTVVSGTPFKPVSGIDANGKEIHLSDVVEKNKFTLLEFWAAWCSPCRAEIPNLKEAYAEYKDKGLEIYSYSIDDSADDWKQALKEDQPNWNIQVLKKGKEGEKVLTLYGVSGIPASYLIDQNGTIVATNDELRGEVLKETLKSLFEKSVK